MLAWRRHGSVSILVALFLSSAVAGSVAEGVRKNGRIDIQATKELILREGLSPHTAVGILVETGSEQQAKDYYKRIGPLIGFKTLENSTLTDFIRYMGYANLTAADLEAMLPNDPRVAAAGHDNMLISRFFAPKIVNFNETNNVASSGNVHKPGWRKLVRLRALHNSDAAKAGMSQGYILFNVFEGDETKDPFLNESGNNQVIVVPKHFNSSPGPNATDSAYWILYLKRSLGYPLGFALNVGFDLPDSVGGPTTRNYFVPVACAQCHGHDAERGRPVVYNKTAGTMERSEVVSAGVYPFAKVNYLDTDQWYDMIDYDFQGTRSSTFDAVFDGDKTDYNGKKHREAFAILRKLNEEIQRQNKSSKRPGDADDFKLKALEKWLDLHKHSAIRVPPISRAINLGAGSVWSATNADDIVLLEQLNKYCFRCHSSMYWSVFDKSFVKKNSGLLEGFIAADLMPQGRKLSAQDRREIVQYLGRIK